MAETWAFTNASARPETAMILLWVGRDVNTRKFGAFAEQKIQSRTLRGF
jgi:hypothetical protein